MSFLANERNVLKLSISKGGRLSINDWVAKICANLSLDKKVTIIITRPFSSIMKNSGASTEYIHEALGHHDKRTTETYLDSFEKEKKKEFAGKLVAFRLAQKCKDQGRPI